MGFRPKISDLWGFYLFSSVIGSFTARAVYREKVDSFCNTWVNKDQVTYSHEYQHRTHFLAARLELGQLFESENQVLRGSNLNGKQPRVPVNFNNNCQ